MTARTTPSTRNRTADRGPPGGAGTIRTVEQLGPNMSKMANGNLLCRNVPIARTGWMMYGPGETPVVPAEGMPVAYVQRTADELFDDDTMSSLEGIAITDEHPEDDVTPANWSRLAKGHLRNVRQGTGDDADVILGDLVITDAGLIRSVLGGKREVSLGYDADYNQTAPGVGHQSRILGNHIALVKKGRCGPRCAIGDREFSTTTAMKERTMPTKRVLISPRRRMTTADRATLDAARQKVLDAQAELEEIEEQTTDAQMEEGGQHIHLHLVGNDDDDDDDADPKKKGKKGKAASKDDGTQGDPNETRFAALETGQQQLADGVRAILDKLSGKEGTKTGDSAVEDDEGTGVPTGDSAALETGYRQVMAQAEVLVPGFRMPTFDGAAKRVDTVATMCKMRRRALDACSLTEQGAGIISGITGKDTLDLDTMSCKDVATLFRATATAKASANNASATRDSGHQQQQQEEVRTGAPTPAELNEIHRKFWESRTPRG